MLHSDFSYQKSSNIIIRIEPQYFDSCIIYDYKKNYPYDFDRSSTEILEYLTTHHLCSNCIENFLRISNSTYTFDDLLSNNFLIRTNLKCQGINEKVNSTQNWIEKVIPENKVVAFLSAPTSVNLVITRRCNMSCIHCNVSASSLEPPDLLPIKIWKKILDELEKNRVFRVILTGGEPFAYKNFKELLIHYGGKRFSKIILTNGAYITEEIALILKKYDICPYISMDGSDSATHDKFRGLEGAFTCLLNSLSILKKHNVKYCITSVVHKKTINQIEGIVQIANFYNADTIVFQPLKPVGRGVMANSWYLENEFYKTIPTTLSKLSKKYLNTKIILTQDEDFLNIGPRKEEIISKDTKYGATSCEAGTWSMTIDHDGLVYPCMLGMELRLHAVGSILKQSANEIWESLSWGVFRNQKFDGCRINTIFELKRQGKPFKKLPILD